MTMLWPCQNVGTHLVYNIPLDAHVLWDICTLCEGVLYDWYNEKLNSQYLGKKDSWDFRAERSRRRNLGVGYRNMERKQEAQDGRKVTPHDRK